jgi:hypothetical protein
MKMLNWTKCSSSWSSVLLNLFPLVDQKVGITMMVTTDVYKSALCWIYVYIRIIVGFLSKSLLEGTAFLTDDEKIPPYIQYHFYSIMNEPELTAQFLDLFNLDRKVWAFVPIFLTSDSWFSLFGLITFFCWYLL